MTETPILDRIDVITDLNYQVLQLRQAIDRSPIDSEYYDDGLQELLEIQEAIDYNWQLIKELQR